MANRKLQTGLAAGLASGIAFGATAVIDRRRVAADPARHLLSDPPEGTAVAVRGADGTKLHCAVQEAADPANAPTIVFVHGWTCRREYWAPQLNALTGQFRLVSYDLRGHGRSEAPANGDFSSDALADDLQAVLRATLPDGQRALLVGHSLGAMSIISWAGRHSEHVRRHAAAALLLSTGTSDLIAESLILKSPSSLARPAEAVSRRAMSLALPYGGPNPLAHRVVRYIALSSTATAAQVAFCERIVLSADRRWRAATARTLSRLDLDHALCDLDVPTVVLSGSADRLTPPVLAARLAGQLPQLLERVELPGVGHMSSVEAPHVVNRHIRALIDQYLTQPSFALSAGP
jgi:pimeloyl-ACP methyl ester carboxylesterase